MKATDGRQLKAARYILGMTTQELAEASGVNRNSVMRAEGQRDLTRHSYAAGKIAEALNDRGITFFTRTGGQAGILFEQEAGTGQ